MKNISLILIGYDTWYHIIYKDMLPNEKIKQFIDHQSKLLMCLTSKLLSSNYVYFVMCINLLLLEIIHISFKIKTNNFNIEDIDCINMDILRIQHHYIKCIENVSMVIFNDIVDDFSYYLEFTEASDKNDEKKNSMNLLDTMDKQNRNNNSYNIKNSDSDNRNLLLNIIKSISQDENFFNINYHFLGNKKLNKPNNNECKTSFDFFIMIFQSPYDYIEQRKWSSFFLNTMGERIYINLIFIHHIFNNPQKMKLYPIAKSIALVSKTADDISILIKILLEAAELNNSMPIRFPYHKAWIFYQCCIVYIIRYIATQEKYYFSDNSLTRYSIFSKFPQETLAPCYFYLDLLREMRNYFVNIDHYIREIKLLISKAKKSIKEKKFQINIPDIFE